MLWPGAFCEVERCGSHSLSCVTELSQERERLRQGCLGLGTKLMAFLIVPRGPVIGLEANTLWPQSLSIKNSLQAEFLSKTM